MSAVVWASLLTAGLAGGVALDQLHHRRELHRITRPTTPEEEADVAEQKKKKKTKDKSAEVEQLDPPREDDPAPVEQLDQGEGDGA